MDRRGKARFSWHTLMFVLGAMALAAVPAAAQSVALTGNHPDLSNVSVGAPLAAQSQLSLTVSFALQNQAAMGQLKAEQQDPASPNYRKWLTPQEFNARFGPSPAQFQAAANWLKASGFTILESNPAERYITVTGPVSLVESVLGVREVAVGSNGLFANIGDPQIPAQFAGVIGQIRGLHNMHAAVALGGKLRPPASALAPRSALVNAFAEPMLLAFASPAAELMDETPMVAAPEHTSGGSTAFGPSDLATYYDITPLLSGGTTGTGTTIGIVGDSDYLASAVTLFNTTFMLPAETITTVLSSNANGTFTNPGKNRDEIEALLDLEWSHAVAQGATIDFYLGDQSNTNNGAISDALQRAVADDTAQVISVSFGLCSSDPSGLANAINALTTQAAMQGQSMFVSTGDQGAAGIVFDAASMSCVVGTTQSVSTPAQDPNVTGVGGTMFTPTYDMSGNDTSTVNDTNTMKAVWDDGSGKPPPANGGAGGGGFSTIFAKPSYQIGVTPNDGHRDVPDISMIASPRSPGAFIGNDPMQAGTPEVQCCIGGTSLAAPVFAGMSALMVQKAGARLGNIDPELYALAHSNGAQFGIRDITAGSNGFNGVAGFSAGPGYDMASGWGEVDANEFVNAFAGSIVTVTAVNTSAMAGQTISDAGSFTLNNNSASSETITGVTLGFSDPALFSKVTVAGGGQTATATPPTATTVFTFPSAVTIGKNSSVTFTMSVTIAMNPAMLDRNSRVAYAAIIGAHNELPGAGFGAHAGIFAMAGGLMMLGFGLLAFGDDQRGRRRMAVGATILAVALMAGVAGCGGGGGSGSSPPPPPSSSQQVQAVAAASGSNPVNYAGLPAQLGTVSLSR